MKVQPVYSSFVKKRNSLVSKEGWYLVIELAKARMRSIEYNTVLGSLWSLVNPIVMLLLMYLIFHRHFGAKITAYPLHLLTGIVCVNFFINATTYVSYVFYQFRETALHSMIPRESFVISELLVHTYKFLIELFLCFVLSSYYGFLGWMHIFIVPLVVTFFFFVLGVGLMISLMTCFVRDIQHIWMIGARLLLFVTPIFYSLESLTPMARDLVYFVNPLTPFVLSFQGVFLGDVRLGSLLHCAALAIACGVAGFYLFLQLERKAVERV